MVRACLVLRFCLAFSAAVSGADNPEATAQAKAYRAVLKAISAGDLEAYKKGLSSATLKQMEDQTKGRSSKEVMDFVKMLTPTDQKITSVSVDGKTSTLKVTGKMDGQAMNGSISMVEEGGQWRVGQPNWGSSK
jgi:predicted lipid-binding transport protein (Tim44 family)